MSKTTAVTLKPRLDLLKKNIYKVLVFSTISFIVPFEIKKAEAALPLLPSFPTPVDTELKLEDKTLYLIFPGVPFSSDQGNCTFANNWSVTCGTTDLGKPGVLEPGIDEFYAIFKHKVDPHEGETLPDPLTLTVKFPDLNETSVAFDSISHPGPEDHLDFYSLEFIRGNGVVSSVIEVKGVHTIPEPSTILGLVSILGLAQFCRKQKIKK